MVSGTDLQRLWFLADKAFLWLDVHIQFELLINPLVIPAKAFHIAQVQKTQTKAPITVVLSQPNQPVGNLSIFIAEIAFIGKAGFTEAKHPTGHLNTDALAHNRFLRRLGDRPFLSYFFGHELSLQQKGYNHSSPDIVRC